MHTIMVLFYEISFKTFSRNLHIKFMWKHEEKVSKSNLLKTHDDYYLINYHVT